MCISKRSIFSNRSEIKNVLVVYIFQIFIFVLAFVLAMYILSGNIAHATTHNENSEGLGVESTLSAQHFPAGTDTVGRTRRDVEDGTRISYTDGAVYFYIDFI